MKVITSYHIIRIATVSILFQFFFPSPFAVLISGYYLLTSRLKKTGMHFLEELLEKQFAFLLTPVAVEKKPPFLQSHQTNFRFAHNTF